MSISWWTPKQEMMLITPTCLMFQRSNILLECKRLFNSKFTNSRVKFNKRQANEVAHALAGEPALSASRTIYFREMIFV